MSKRRAAFLTLGCKVNQYETDAMEEILEKAGYEIVSFKETADVYIINTCSVTNMADRKSRQMIHRAKKNNPDAIIVAAGCYVQAAEEELEKITIEDEVTDEICEVCGRNMVIKYGPHGKFLACPGFPECRNTKPYYEKIGVACPKCGKDVVIKMTKKGRRYYGCIDYPECDFMSWGRPVDKKCPRCGGYMVEKGNKLACADEHCGYTEQKEKEK